MNTSRSSADHESMRMFEEALRKCFPRKDFPLEIIGDLDDLKFTVERLMSALSVISGGQNCSSIEKALYDIEFILSEELSLIASDLIPTLRELRTHSY